MDCAIVNAGGRVVAVHRNHRPSLPLPVGLRAHDVVPGSVHHGYVWDGQGFRPPVAPTPHWPRSRLEPIYGETIPASAAGAPVAAGQHGGNSNVITINVQSPTTHQASPPAAPVAHEIVTQPFPPGPQAMPRVETGLPPSLSPGAVVAPAQEQPPGSASTFIDHRQRALSTLRSIQLECWPPEREQVADWAAVFMTYGDPTMVPDLVAMTPHGMALADVASVALEARAVASAWIAEIGALIDHDVPLVVTSEDADRVISRGRAIVEAGRG